MSFHLTVTGSPLTTMLRLRLNLMFDFSWVFFCWTFLGYALGFSNDISRDPFFVPVHLASKFHLEIHNYSPSLDDYIHTARHLLTF